MESNWHSMSYQDVVKNLKTNIENGLTQEEVERKREEFGVNELEAKKKKSLFVKFLEQFKDFMIIVLIISAIISNKMTLPLKKIENGMKLISEGKFPDNLRMKEENEFEEYKELIDVYTSMLKVIKKNTFDLNSQESKTEIILEHMADGVIAFSTSR